MVVLFTNASVLLCKLITKIRMIIHHHVYIVRTTYTSESLENNLPKSYVINYKYVYINLCGNNNLLKHYIEGFVSYAKLCWKEI